MIRLSYQPLYMPFIAQNFTGTTCYECGQLASKGGARAGRWSGGGVLVGQGGKKRAWKRCGLPHGPPHIITTYFLESVRGGRAISSPSPVSLFSADARRAIRFWLSMVYSIAVPHVSENARQRVSPLVSGVRAGLSGVRHERDRCALSVPPFPFELAKCDIFYSFLSLVRAIDR